MQIGISIGLTAGRGASGGAAPVDADVAAWLTRVASAGGTVSAGTQSAVEAFVASCKSASIWTLITRLNLCCGDFLASFVPQVNTVGSATDTNVNFVSGDYSESTGWTTDGSTKYINTGYTPSEATGGLSAYLRTAQTSNTTTRAIMGCRNAGSTQAYYLLGNSTGLGVATAGSVAGYWGGALASAGATATGGVIAALWHTTRVDGTHLNFYENGVAQGSSFSGTTPATSGNSLFVFCRNAGTPGTFCEANTRISGYGVDSGMNATKAAAYYTAMQAFQTAMGRQV